MVATVGADFLLVRQESIRNIDSGRTVLDEIAYSRITGAISEAVFL